MSFVPYSDTEGGFRIVDQDGVSVGVEVVDNDTDTATDATTVAETDAVMVKKVETIESLGHVREEMGLMDGIIITSLTTTCA